jgi:DNA-binding NarL/FixJ family response regulator
MRSRVRVALEAGGFEVCGEAANAAKAVEIALDCRPDVVLLDIHMPGNGIRAAKEITWRVGRRPSRAPLSLKYSSRSGRPKFAGSAEQVKPRDC